MPVSSVARSLAVGPTLRLSQGAQGPAVAELQALLQAAGFDPGPVDGDFGPMTRAAVMAFQRERGLVVDGVAGAQTFAALRAAAPETPEAPTPAAERPTLQLGSRGPAVAELQRALAAAGVDPGPVDGDFGPMTRAAVRQFQARNGLTVDGLVGPQTWGALDGTSFVPGADPVAPVAPGDSDFRARILAIAQAEVGTVEATNRNDGDVTRYPAFFGRGAEPYCADFVSYVLTQAGGSLNNSWCPSIRNLLIQSGQWKGRTAPEPGDLVLFDWDHDGVADHVGLVKRVNANGTLTTIEGNTSGPGGQQGVWEKTHSWDFVMDFGSPL